MITDHRPDTLTPRLKQLTTFDASAPLLLEAARTGDSRLALLTRQALREVRHYDCPIGLRVGKAWVFVAQMKLESPNKFRAHWTLQNTARTRWEKYLRVNVALAMKAASWGSVVALKWTPHCTEKMVLQIVRLVPSSREFIKDDDNLAASRKSLQDSLKRLGLLKDDRREWLEVRATYQDVSPIRYPLTVIFLWPAAADLF